jgi:hypothetical protein
LIRECLSVRGYLLLIKLPYAAEHLENEIGSLAAKLPSGSRRVLYTEREIGFLLPQETIAEIVSVRLGPVMSAFSDWWLLGLDGQLACKNGSMDPFWHWMHERGGGGIKRIPKLRQTQNVLLPERRKPRL